MKYECPCCRNYTLPEEAPGTDYICKVCFWQDDYIQYHNPEYKGGANEECLSQARKNYREFGVSELKYSDKVRTPTFEELPENNQ